MQTVATISFLAIKLERCASAMLRVKQCTQHCQVSLRPMGGCIRGIVVCCHQYIQPRSIYYRDLRLLHICGVCSLPTVKFIPNLSLGGHNCHRAYNNHYGSVTVGEPDYPKWPCLKSQSLRTITVINITIQMSQDLIYDLISVIKSNALYSSLYSAVNTLNCFINFNF